MDSISEQWQVEKRFEPSMDKSDVDELTKGWKRAVKAARVWAEG
jgi:glycerol kinase